MLLWTWKLPLSDIAPLLLKGRNVDIANKFAEKMYAPVFVYEACTLNKRKMPIAFDENVITPP